MSFTVSCFIRQNTPQIRKKLEELGYISQSPLSYKYLFTFQCNGIGYYSSTVSPINNPNEINCGTNEDLFLALAALRDDTDYMQWFVSVNKVAGNYVPIPGFNGRPTIDMDKWWYHEWILSPHDTITSHRYRKATKEEIINHFIKPTKQ